MLQIMMTWPAAALTTSLIVAMSFAPRLPAAADPADGSPRLQTYHSKQREGIIKNPGVGYQTFDQSALTDRQFPSSTMYVRLDWSAVEPASGVFNFMPIDRALAEARAAGQRLAFRIMAYEEGNGGPVALRRAGYPGFGFKFGNDETWVPDLNDSRVQQDLKSLITAAGQRYGDNPAIDSIDVGLIGDWGEQHFWNTKPQPPYPSSATLQWLFRLFSTNFKVPVIINDGIWENDPDAFRLALQSGIGWRADCWGGSREMNGKYPRILADVPNAWQTAPVIMEPCGVMADWVAHRLPWRDSLQWAIDNHVSELSNKSARIPAEMLPGLDSMLARLGYRIALSQATFPIAASKSAGLPLSLRWENNGNAPMYMERHVLVGLGPEVVDTGLSMRGFLPGTRDDVVSIPTRGLPAGTYEVRIGLGPPQSHIPDITLAIDGQGPWYTLGEVTLH